MGCQSDDAHGLGGTTSSAATICHFPFRRNQVSVHTNLSLIPSLICPLRTSLRYCDVPEEAYFYIGEMIGDV
jgi:hypothetical protein